MCQQPPPPANPVYPPPPANPVYPPPPANTLCQQPLPPANPVYQALPPPANTVCRPTPPANLMSQSMLPASSMFESNTVTALPPPLFSTPPKLVPVEEVMKDYPGSDVATLPKIDHSIGM